MRIHVHHLLRRLPGLTAMALAGLVLLACDRAAAPAPPSAPSAPPPPPGPVETTARLIEHLRRDRLTAWAQDAVPPALYAELETAWREDRSRWPLSELPLDRHLPGFVVALAAPDAEPRLQAAYRRQFAGARTELRSAAATLGLFGEQYLRREGDYSDNERAHYLQLVRALSAWGQRAPLADRRRAETAIAELARAARHSGLRSPDAFARYGLRGSLRRLGPVYGRLKQVLAGYGLDWDAALADARLDLVSQDGDRARVRLRYRLADAPIEALLDLERIDGRWYLSDALRHARRQADSDRTAAARQVAGSR